MLRHMKYFQNHLEVIYIKIWIYAPAQQYQICRKLLKNVLSSYDFSVHSTRYLLILQVGLYIDQYNVTFLHLKWPLQQLWQGKSCVHVQHTLNFETFNPVELPRRTWTFIYLNSHPTLLELSSNSYSSSIYLSTRDQRIIQILTYLEYLPYKHVLQYYTNYL